VGVQDIGALGGYLPTQKNVPWWSFEVSLGGWKWV